VGICEEISVRTIKPTSKPLRSHVGQLDELMDSIKKTGLLQAILIRSVGDSYEVVAGNRRLEAFRRLKIRKIPCHVVEMDDREAYEVSLVENLQRQTLNPMEEAESFKRYVDEYGYGGISELAKRIGKSQEYVTRRIQLLDLPREVREGLMRRRISSSIAQELIAMRHDDTNKILDLIQDQSLTVRDVRRMVKLSNGRGSVDGLALSDAKFGYESFERQIHDVDRVLRKCISVLKVSLTKFDDALNYMPENEWVAMETLTTQRTLIHKQIDELMNFKKRLNRNPKRFLEGLPSSRAH